MAEVITRVEEGEEGLLRETVNVGGVETTFEYNPIICKSPLVEEMRRVIISTTTREAVAKVIPLKRK